VGASLPKAERQRHSAVGSVAQSGRHLMHDNFCPQRNNSAEGPASAVNKSGHFSLGVGEGSA